MRPRGDTTVTFPGLGTQKTMATHEEYLANARDLEKRAPVMSGPSEGSNISKT